MCTLLFCLRTRSPAPTRSFVCRHPGTCLHAVRRRLDNRLSSNGRQHTRFSMVAPSTADLDRATTYSFQSHYLECSPFHIFLYWRSIFVIFHLIRMVTFTYFIYLRWRTMFVTFLRFHRIRGKMYCIYEYRLVQFYQKNTVCVYE